MKEQNPKKIIVIGASSGMGRQLALLYAQKGHKVGIVARREPLLREIKQKYPEQIITACFDVTKGHPVHNLRQLIAALGGLDLLIYNAGYGEVSLHLNPEIEKHTTQTNVVGFVAIVCFCFNYFVHQGQGQIAVTSSVAALRGNSRAPAYSASKAFMSIYAEGLNLKARKLKKDIVVTDIRPGFVDTKPSKNHRRFWVEPPLKAARQIIRAIEKRKRVAYISRRWWLVAQILKLLPFWVYRRLG